MRGKLVVFDLDGTIALNGHRSHFVERPVGEKDWTSFFDACDKDAPNAPVITTLLALFGAGCNVEIWSGRTDRVRAKTEKWLAENGLGHIRLQMRKEHDHTPDHILKKQWLDESSMRPFMVFDDRDSVVAMWRENDIACFQVAPGAF